MGLHSRIIVYIAASASVFGCGRSEMHEDQRRGLSHPVPPLPPSVPAPVLGPMPAATDSAASPLPPAADRAWWLAKATRALHYGEGSLSAAQEQKLAQASDRDAVQSLLDDPRYQDTLADFTLYYLGFKAAKYAVHPGGVAFQPDSLAAVPPAVDAVFRLAKGDDFLGILTPSGPTYVPPLGQVSLDSKGKKLDAVAGRAAFYKALDAKMAELAALSAAGKPISRDTFCKLGDTDLLAADHFLLFPDFARSGIFDFQQGPMTPFTACFMTNAPIPQDVTTAMVKARSLLATRVAYLNTFEPAVYKVAHVLDYRTVDTTLLSSFPDDNNLTWFWSALPNSSTNHDRKRASYVLKHVFCDDLTPIKVATPAEHAGSGQHASDPACQACHFKLDPMAGFFRYYGAFGENAKSSSSIRFDDNAETSVSDYVQAWRGEDSKRPWQIGFIRSTTDLPLNDYGDHPEDPDFADLTGIIKRAPEAKQCLVRRLFEYFVGVDQALDPAYLEEVTQKFTALYAKDSGAAFKATISDIVLSQTFRTPDPASEECYDHAASQLPGTQPTSPGNQGGRPPCRVLFLLDKACVSCHRGVAAAGHLDLSRWVVLPGDPLPRFPHLGANGTQLTRGASLQLIQDRLAATDPALRMPLSGSMDNADRAALFTWLAATLNEKGP